jgi:ribosome-binding ATPase
MSLKVGIVGLPNVGKSTLFNALLKKRVALSANYPFATVEPNVGVVAVPDNRLQRLAEIVKVEEKMDSLPPLVPAVVEFVDIAGLVKGAAEGAGLGNQFLSHIREVDAIIHVLRDFSDPNIVREGSVAPDEDKLTIETELGLSDLQVLEKLVLDRTLEPEKMEILKRIQEELNAGHILGNFQIGDEKLRSWFQTLPLLSIKPVLYVYNVAEDEYATKMAGPNFVISAKLEEELADVTEDERLEYLKELGIEETGLERLIKKAYEILGLISFLTAGKKEVRAWTIKRGTKAPDASGAIHTDFIKKFIRAQVIPFDKYIEAGSLNNAKTKGWVRTEGKEYVVADGDVIEFLVGT